ncbi:MAG: DUF4157 domain-containing protein [Bacteroidota bacterium]
MFSTADKTNHHATAVQQKAAGTSFFRKAGEETFFGSKRAGEKASFFGSPIQAKLSVSSPDDPQEKEADAVASQVMRMSEPVMATGKNEEEKIQSKEEEPQDEAVHAKLQSPVISIQRKCDGCDKEEKTQAKLFRKFQRSEDEFSSETADAGSDAGSSYSIDRKPISLYRSDIIQRSGRGPPATSIPFEQQLSSSKGAGSPMPSDTQQFMESRFNADFSGVRIHTGSNAENLSSNIHAQAFAHGNDIYFNSGKYSPHTESGGTLLAHELTHTVQQGASGSKKVARKIDNALPETAIQARRINSRIQLQTSVSPVSDPDLSGRSGGSALSTGAKEYLQDYYNTNLSDIRIHTGNEALAVCRAAGVNAFVKDNHIFITPSKYDPESEQGAILLSEKIGESLKQRGIKTTSKDGNEVGSVMSLVNQIAAAIQQNKADETKVIPAAKATVTDLSKGRKKAKPGDKKNTNVADQKKSSKKGKGKKKNSEGPVFKPSSKNPKRSPAKPSEDPAFLKVVNKTKTTANNQKQHEPAEKKSSEAQNSAESVPKEAESKAQNRKTDGMGEAAKEDRPFDAETFKADLLKKIEEVTPKNLEEATEFKENNKISQVKGAMGEKVATEKGNSTGPVDKATEQPLQVNDADNKKPVALPPTVKGARPPPVGAKDAAPKNKTNEETSMQEQSQSLDDEMKSNNMTEEKLNNSNEPEFQDAVKEKQGAQKDAIEKPREYKKEEAQALKIAKSEATVESEKTITVMNGSRGKNFGESVKHQQTAKEKDEQTRADIAAKIEGMYKTAEEKVNKALEDADKESGNIFDVGAEAARIEFENYVDEKMRAYKQRRYSGFWGGLKWAKDKLFGMPDEVNEFYTDGRALYLKKMDKVITDVANTVTQKLNEAKQAIKDGKKEIDKFVSELPKNQQDIGKEAASNIQDKFDTLEQNVNDKRNDLIEGMAKKYVDNVKKLDERINELKDANKGLIDKAIGFLKKIWKVIKDLVDLFTTILARLASIVGVIIDNPGGFFDNVGKAFKQGLKQFTDKFVDYLEKGLMEWLATNLGIGNIDLPEKFSPASILSLVLQVMGVTKEHIKERAIAVLGPRKVALLESAGGLLHRVYNEGLGALWELIEEKLSDLKEIVWEAIKSFIKTKIIEAAITFILSLLNPIGAFVKVCMAIYDFLMMLVRFKDKIIELLDTILGAVTDIAGGAVDTAANAIEKAFAKSIPIIIAFLAALLHLNDIASKVRGIITRIKARIDKAIDFVIVKAYGLVGKLVEGTLKIQDKGTELVEKGKDKVIAVGKTAIASILKWLGLKKEFSGSDGKPHKLYFSGSEEEPVLTVRSNPTAYGTFISGLDVGTDVNKIKAKGEAVVIAGSIDTKRRAPLAGTTEDEKAKSKEEKIKEVERLLNDLAVPTAVLFGDPGAAGEPEVVNTMQGAGHAITMNAKKLNKKQTLKGSPPTASNTASYGVLNTRRQSASASYYVKGHMLNDNIGGKGVWENLTPLSREGNSNHEGNVESLVKAAYNSGAIVEYNVTAEYGYGNNAAVIPADDPKREQKLKIIEEEKHVPTQLKCDAWIMEKKGDVFEQKQSIVSAIIPNPIGQDAASYILEGEPGKPDVYLNSSDVTVIAGINIVGAALALKIEQAHKETGKSKFYTYSELSKAKMKDGSDVFTTEEKTSVLALAGLNYVKLFKASV